MEELVKLKDNTLVWTSASGTGLPAIVLNGGPGMADYLGPVAHLLQDHLQVHRYEQRGCGRTDSTGPFTLNAFVSDIEELRVHWGFQRWYVLGHSWGVDLALAYAMAHPASILGLVGLSGGRLHNDRDWKQVYDENKYKEEMPPATAAPNRTVNKLLNDEWKAYCRLPDLLRELAAFDLPALFLYGENDIRPSWPTEQLSSLLPNSQFKMVQNADHHLWQGNPDSTRDAILRFLREHPSHTMN